MSSWTLSTSSPSPARMVQVAWGWSGELCLLAAVALGKATNQRGFPPQTVLKMCTPQQLGWLLRKVVSQICDLTHFKDWGYPQPSQEAVSSGAVRPLNVNIDDLLNI